MHADNAVNWTDMWLDLYEQSLLIRQCTIHVWTVRQWDKWVESLDWLKQQTSVWVYFYLSPNTLDIKLYLLVVKVKVKLNQSTCIAPCMVQATLKRSGMDHTAFNLQRTPCLPIHRKRSPDGASTECGGEHLIAAHYSFIDPERIKAKLAWFVGL